MEGELSGRRFGRENEKASCGESSQEVGEDGLGSVCMVRLHSLVSDLKKKRPCWPLCFYGHLSMKIRSPPYNPCMLDMQRYPKERKAICISEAIPIMSFTIASLLQGNIPLFRTFLNVLFLGP